MNRIANWKIAVASLVLLTAPAMAASEDFNAVDGPNVRVTRHEDGGRTLFIRTPDKRTLTKKTFTADGVLCMVTIYRMDENGNPLGCKILDGQKSELFKVSYGYHKDTGLLMEERMFDARVKRMDPQDGKEMPVHRFIYNYDAQGKRSAPISITLTPGKTANEVFGGGASALDKNPFGDQPRGKPVNPKARGVGR
jgi:hypothetical protein